MKIVKRGHFYITSSEVRGVRYLRLTVINPLTTAKHIQGLIEDLLEWLLVYFKIEISNILEKIVTLKKIKK